MAIRTSDTSALELSADGTPPVALTLVPPLGARGANGDSRDGSAIAAGTEAAVLEAVATLADTALQAANKADASSAKPPVLRQADRTGGVAARTAALQAAAAGALADTAKAARDLAVQRAKQQAAAAAALGRVKGKSAAVAARAHGSQAARAIQGQAAQTVAGIRASGQEFVTTTASRATVQKLSRKARRGSKLQQWQGSQRRRQASVLVVLAAIVGIAVGLWERRRRAAAAAVQPDLGAPVDSIDLTGPSQPDSTSDRVVTALVSPESGPDVELPASGGPQG